MTTVVLLFFFFLSLFYLFVLYFRLDMWQNLETLQDLVSWSILLMLFCIWKLVSCYNYFFLWIVGKADLCLLLYFLLLVMFLGFLFPFRYVCYCSWLLNLLSLYLTHYWICVIHISFVHYGVAQHKNEFWQEEGYSYPFLEENGRSSCDI